MEGLSFQDPSFETNERSSSRTFIVVIAIVLLLGVGIFGASRFNLFGTTTKPSPTPLPTMIPTEKPSPTKAPTETPAPTGKTKTTPSPTLKASPTPAKKTGGTLDKAALSVSVKNGSGKPGAAQQGADTLNKLGYTVASTGNADNYDYLDITIQIKPSKQSYLTQLKKDLSSAYTVGSTSATLSESSSPDAVVIVGK